MADVGHIAAASKVCIEIDAERVPRVAGVSPVQAASSGEEYEIVVTGAKSLGTSNGSFANRMELITRLPSSASISV